MDGERVKGEVVMLEKNYKEKARDGRTCPGTLESVDYT